MIKNEREYKITNAAAERFRAAIKEHDASPPKRNVAPKLRNVERDAMRSQLADLDRQLKAYDRLKNGSGEFSATLQELGVLLVQARIARRWSQQELADHLGVKMQQIQRYEATNYESAN